ncbi:MAG: TrkH family potassium uptake protein [Planctomycetota bacterium]|nr:TrkH family potassium uptake protein [Planctomycetota bacterium]
MNFRAVGRLLGVILLLLAGFLLIPAMVAGVYNETGAVADFLISAGITMVLGGTLYYRNRASKQRASLGADYFRREGLAVVGLSWFVGGFATALPFLVGNTFGSLGFGSFVNAYFEGVSGLTTTGSTVMSAEQIDSMSHALAFWRSFSHWLGGFGIVMVFVVLFPTGGRSLFRSEIPGVSREAGHQRVRDSALTLMRIYVFITVVEFVLLMLAGLIPFDALLHSLATIPTGGFSNHSGSVGGLDNVAAEVIITVFMFLCGINFGLYDLLLRAGWKPFVRRLWGSSEFRWYLGLAVASIVTITTILYLNGGTNGDASMAARASGKDYSNLGTALRDSSFLVVAMQTSTGFGTVNFDLWPQFTRVLLMFLAVVGACAGSTGGGIKMVRVMVVSKAAIVGVKRFIRPRAIHAVRVDGQSLDEKTVASIISYFALWVMIFMAGTLFLSAFGIDLVSAATAVLATLNNIGPGLHMVGPFANFATMPDMVKLVLSFFMILGRLEFYAAVALLMPSLWKR